MASDGSVRAPNGSFAWVIYGNKSETHWSGRNTITKGHSDLSSFCKEACEHLGALYALRALLQAYLPPANSPAYTTIRINNLGVVRRSSYIPFSIQQWLLPDWDIFNKATQVQHSISRVIKVQHVKNHQDHDTNTPETLPLPARLNILADAGTHRAYTDCPHFLPNTISTLHTCGPSHQQQPHHIQPSLICLFGLLYTHYVKVLWRIALLVRRNLSVNRLESIWQGIQMASHRTPISIIQASKRMMANVFCSQPASTNPVAHLSKVLSWSWDAQSRLMLSPGPDHLASKVVYSGNNTQVNTQDPKPHLQLPWAWHKIMAEGRPQPTMAISPPLW